MAAQATKHPIRAATPLMQRIQTQNHGKIQVLFLYESEICARKLS
jgi:hypothetical protein